METTKKTLLIALVILFTLGSTYGGFYFFKKYFVKSPQNDILTQTEQVPAIPGFQRDMMNEISEIFPKKLVPEEDISMSIESFTFLREDQKKEYTFRYVSKKSPYDNFVYFTDFLSKNGWHLNDAPSFLERFISILSSKVNGETVSVNIAQVESIGTVVTILYLK